MSGKRKDYISWDEYFMGVAVLSGMRSKDPNTQVGACIVSEDHKILSMGYNGFPTGCSDDEFPWEREGEPLENKYFYTTHSELNAILNYRGGSLEGATISVIWLLVDSALYLVSCSSFCSLSNSMISFWILECRFGGIDCLGRSVASDGAFFEIIRLSAAFSGTPALSRPSNKMSSSRNSKSA